MQVRFFILIIVAAIVLTPTTALSDGASEAEWCLTRATKRIHKQSMRNNYCPQYLGGWAQHHQNNLARDAIQAIVCENNISRAIDYLRVCQCHNKGVHDALPGYASEIRDWAMIRAPQIGLVCPSPPNPTSSPQRSSAIDSACICQYGNGQIAAWFRFKPDNYGQTGLLEVSSNNCEDLSICQRFEQSSGHSYTFYKGQLSLKVNHWSTSANLVTGFQLFSVWGTLDQ